jgi:hypothetical protein
MHSIDQFLEILKSSLTIPQRVINSEAFVTASFVSWHGNSIHCRTDADGKLVWYRRSSENISGGGAIAPPDIRINQSAVEILHLYLPVTIYSLGIPGALRESRNAPRK